MRKTLLVILILIFSNTTFAQGYQPVEDVDVLATNADLIKRVYPHTFENLMIDSVYSLNDRYSIVGYSNNGDSFEAVLNSGRKDMLLVATYKEISKSELPDIVRDAFKESNYSNWKIKKAFKVKTPYSNWSYAIDAKSDKKTKRLHYSDLGVSQPPLYK